MSLEAFVSVKRLRGVNATERLLLYAMADYADRGGQSVFPSVPTLADELEVDERTVQRTIRSLEERGLLVRAGMSGRAPYQTVVYALPFVQGGQFVTPSADSGVTVGVAPVSPDPGIRLVEEDPDQKISLISSSRSGSSGSRGRFVTPAAPSAVTRALWDAYTDLTTEVFVPNWAERQFDHWMTLGCTVEHVEETLRAVATAQPDKPWGFFKARLAEALIKPPPLPADGRMNHGAYDQYISRS